jgi:hypothetical protein
LAVFVFAVWAVAWSCGAHHVPIGFEEFRLFFHVFELCASLFLLNVASLHCSGALCAPPLARHAGLLEPIAGRWLSGSTGGTRFACWLSFGDIAESDGSPWGEFELINGDEVVPADDWRRHK